MQDNLDGAFPPAFVAASAALGRYDDVVEKVRRLIEHFSPVEYPKILDVCCGSGHFAKSLSEGGYEVTGIDLSCAQIERARALAPNAKFEVRDMKDVPSGVFDIILNTYSSFGYKKSRQDDRNVLGEWHNALRSGGALIMELSDLERAKYSFNFPNSVIVRESDGVREDLSIDWEEQMLSARYMSSDFDVKVHTRIYSRDELTDMLSDIGFVHIACYGDFNRATKNPKDRLVIIAHRA